MLSFRTSGAEKLMRPKLGSEKKDSQMVVRGQQRSGSPAVDSAAV